MADRRLGLLAVLLWVTLLAAPARPAEPPQRSAAELMDVVMWNREPVGGAFRLFDPHGRVRRDTDFRGKLMLVYFGYTFCPDICPTDLQQIGIAMEKLGAAASEVVPVFITLDPERDTRQLLSQYVPAFHPRIVGLTGSRKAVDQAARAYKVYHARVAVDGWARYTIDHSSFIYVMGRQGQYLGFMPPSTPADRMVEVLRPFLQAGQK